MRLRSLSTSRLSVEPVEILPGMERILQELNALPVCIFISFQEKEKTIKNIQPKEMLH
jgi:hypothetical protein